VSLIDGAGAGGGFDDQLGARLRMHHFVIFRDILLPPGLPVSVVACRCLAHHGDRPPNSKPGKQLVPVASPEHPIRTYRGFEFGVAAMRVHHQVRGTVDIKSESITFSMRVLIQRAG